MTPNSARTSERIFVWLGGVLFVASLAYCLWWYVVVLSLPERDRYIVVFGRDTHLDTGPAWIPFDAALFSIFALHHSVLARGGVQARLARVIPARLLRSVYVWTASLLIFLLCIVWMPIGGTVYHVTGWRAAVHAAAQWCGLGLIVWSVSGIDPLELAGIREESARGGLQTAGPYRWVRHPLYLGWVIAVFGAAHLTGDRLAFAGITTLYLMIAVPWEERSLTTSFGEEYRRYQRRVRWRIVPYVF